MLNDFLLSFFLAAPAVVMAIRSREMTNPVARVMLFWGGLAAVVMVAMVVVPMLACDGHLTKAYAHCIGGEGLAVLFNRAQPLILGAAKIYVLIGIPLAIVAFMVEWAGRRRGNSAALQSGR